MEKSFDRVVAKCLRAGRKRCRQYVLGNGFPGRIHKFPKDLKLPDRKIERPACEGEAARSTIEFQLPDFDGVFGALRTSHQSAQPGLYLANVKRLSKIVVGSSIEPRDSILGRIARAQYKHWPATAAAALQTQRLQFACEINRTGGVRRQLIEHDHIYVCCAPLSIGFLNIRRSDYLVPRMDQTGQQKGAGGRAVFDEKDAHRPHDSTATDLSS